MVTYSTKILLAFRSGGNCALCHNPLTFDSANGGPGKLGQAAHISGENNGKGKKSARFDPSMSEADRNHFKNLIYLCGSCHTKIDTIPQGELDYPVSRLLEIKAEHELRVRRAMVDEFVDFGFPELEEATEWVMKIDPHTIIPNFSLLRIEDKIRKNELSGDSRAVISTSLGVAGEVVKYIESVSQIDPDFPDRLTAGFLEEYYRLRKESLKGDDLFDLMCNFAQRGFKRQSKRSAGLAVMVYLFEACEIFEK